MRYIYISPHLDDAVLSAGGLIYEQTRAGHTVEIWTMMCGFPADAELSPFAQLLHHQWRIPAATDVVHARRAEDVNAAETVGARAVHFDFLDCIYRRGNSGDWLYTDVFVPPHADEPNLPQQIAAAIAARLQPDDQLICQLTIGRHVDHVTVRHAVELLGRRLLYDADIPYLFNAPETLAPQVSGMTVDTRRVSAAAIQAWQEGITQYTSQISSLFDSLDDMRAKIQNYAEEHNGVRLWSPT